MTESRRTRNAGLAVGVVAVAVVATAFALGGSGSGGSSAGSSSGSTTSSGSAGGEALSGSSAAIATAPHAAASAAASAPESGSARSSSAASGFAAGVAQNVDDGVTATRVVKTGSLELRVPRGQVDATMTKLVGLTNGLHGYVSRSSTSSDLGSPSGEVTLRIPAASFDPAVNEAEKLGHVLSLSTNASDVTGKFVDLGARLAALKQTRSTYLTILGQARTIGATLSVQQRVDDVQQQIEELQGQLKVLANQSSDGTLTIDISQPGAPAQHHVAKHHGRSGIGAAWHRSVSRFERGGDAIVGALGPLVLALLIIAAVGGIGYIGYRGMRRAASSLPTGE